MQAENTSERALRNAAVRLLRPLVRILLRRGMPYQFLADVVKQVYVEVAREDFAIPGRKVSDSRVSILTGLSRKEVLRLRRLPTGDNERLAEKYNRAARVISAWRSDRRFLDTRGRPAALPLEGRDQSFASLVHAYGADVPLRAVTDELIRVGVVKPLKDGRLRLVARAYVPAGAEDEKIDILGRDVADLISTIDHNLEAERHEAFVQRKVAYDNLPGECLSELRDLSSREAQRLLERLDAWLARRDRDRSPTTIGSGRHRAGVGVYYFEEELAPGDREND